MAETSTPTSFPSSIDEFQVLAKLGEGASGKVYLATVATTSTSYVAGELYALKVYKASILKEANQLQRIKREVEIAGKVDSNYVVKIFEFREVAAASPSNEVTVGTPYLVMQYLDGMTLYEWIRMYHPGSDRLLTTTIHKILEGLAAIHEAGIRHRDIKPHNIIITSRFEPVITDLGIAYASGFPPITEDNPDAKQLGSFVYTAPEIHQFPKDPPYSNQSDLYSVGATIYFMLSGREPLCDVPREDRSRKILRGMSESLWFESDHEEQKKLFNFSKTLLSLDPKTRYDSCRIAQLALKDISTGKDPQHPPRQAYIASALTGLASADREAMLFVSHWIATICKQFEIFAWQPRKFTDPEIHHEVRPDFVYALDRKRVICSDVIIAVCNYPSLGLGQELEIAASYGIPVILISRKDTPLSRMATGAPLNRVANQSLGDKADVTYSTPEDLQENLADTLRRCEKRIVANRANLDKDSSRAASLLSKLRKDKALDLDTASLRAGVAPELLTALENKTDYWSNVGRDTLRRILSVYGETLDSFEIRLAGDVPEDATNKIIRKKLLSLAQREDWPLNAFSAVLKRTRENRAAFTGTTVPSDDDLRALKKELEPDKS